MSTSSAIRRQLYQWFARVHGVVLIATKGRPVSMGRNLRFFVLETLGRRSGVTRRLPLLFMPYGPDFIVLASNYGQEHPPAWYLNLQADPNASVLTGGQRIDVRARVLEGDERRAIRSSLVEYNAHWNDYLTNVERTIPVVVLERR
jgi:deazaflavin-dependent oxidoreductase (nitroreductase family)